MGRAASLPQTHHPLRLGRKMGQLGQPQVRRRRSAARRHCCTRGTLRQKGRKGDSADALRRGAEDLAAGDPLLVGEYFLEHTCLKKGVIRA